MTGICSGVCTSGAVVEILPDGTSSVPAPALPVAAVLCATGGVESGTVATGEVVAEEVSGTMGVLVAGCEAFVDCCVGFVVCCDGLVAGFVDGLVAERFIT